MTAHEEKPIIDEKRMKELLKQALPPITPDAEPLHDLWPAVLRRLDTGPAPARLLPHRLPWFDWALIAGLIVFAIAFPGTIPVFLYYL